MPIDKIMNAGRDVADLQIAASTQFGCNIDRNIPRPAVGDVKRDDADRVGILPVEQVLDDVLNVGSLNVAFAIDQAEPAEIVDNEAGVYILARNDPTASNWTYALQHRLGWPSHE
jgi:hypothetical protein